MDQHRQRAAGEVLRLRLVALGLLRTGAALDDGVDELEVAGVGRERDADLLALVRPVGAGRPLVVLDVARPAARARRHDVEVLVALELRQDLRVGPPDRVREHVQPPAVRHAHEDVAHASVRGQAERLVEHRDQRVEPLDREALRAQERAVDVRLERLGVGEAAEDPLLLLGGQGAAVLARLDPVAQPHALLVVRDVLDLVGDRAAVRLAQMRQRLGKRRSRYLDPQDVRGDLLHHLRRQADRRRLERRVADGLRAERVEPCSQVTVRAVRLHQRGGRLYVREHLLRRRRARWRRHGLAQPAPPASPARSSGTPARRSRRRRTAAPRSGPGRRPTRRPGSRGGRRSRSWS